MSTSSGPHIIRESLAFGYDTGYGLTNRGIATRFCKGEPTTNIWYDSYGQDINTRSDFQAPMQSTAGLNQSVRPETWNGNRIWQLDRTAGSAGTYDSWRRCVDTSVSNNYGSTRYVSIKICLPFGGSISELALHTGGGMTGWTNTSGLYWWLGHDPQAASWTSGAGSNFDGDISIFKTYSRILSNSEVRRNYRAYRKRFDL